MNFKRSLLILSAVATGALAAPAAFAGEGGIAGSAGFILDPTTGGFVTEASVAAAVGKVHAYAGATTNLAPTAAPTPAQS